MSAETALDEAGAQRAAVALLTASLRSGAAPATLRVRGSCMRPLLESGDEIVVSALDGRPKTGELLLCREGDGLVCHRLVARHGTEMTLAGDASTASASVGSEVVIGRVVAISRGERLLALRRGGWAWRHRILGLLATLRWRLARGMPRGTVRRVVAGLFRVAQRQLAGR